MSPSLVAENEGARQPCFTKSAEEPGGHGGVCGGMPIPHTWVACLPGTRGGSVVAIAHAVD
jgi:hypothetical protein